MYMKNILDYSTFLKSGITEGRLGRLGALASVVAATSCLSPDPKGDWVVANINTTDRGSLSIFWYKKPDRDFLTEKLLKIVVENGNTTKRLN